MWRDPVKPLQVIGTEPRQSRRFDSLPFQGLASAGSHLKNAKAGRRKIRRRHPSPHALLNMEMG
jgi:hypothetical protein